MIDPLQILKKFFGPSEGNFITVLDHQGEEPSWRLDLLYDERMSPKMVWTYQEWASGRGLVKSLYLKDDELYGYLLAKFPEKDLRKEITDITISLLQEIMDELKEPSR